jgi:hypothetical protein
VPVNKMANRRTRARPNWDVYSPRQQWMRKAIPYGTKLRPAMWVPSRAVKNSAAVSMPKPGSGVGRERRKEWCWGMAPTGFGIRRIYTFPEAIQIVDLYHAREHLWSLAAKLYANNSPGQKRWVMVRKDKLDDGKIERLVASLRSLEASHPGLAGDIRTEANYFESNKERMRYPQFRKQGLFVGSGVIEAGCKTVLGRLKRSGMFWTLRGANAIIALRCSQLSGKFEEYWETRRA